MVREENAKTLIFPIRTSSRSQSFPGATGIKYGIWVEGSRWHILKLVKIPADSFGKEVKGPENPLQNKNFHGHDLNKAAFEGRLALVGVLCRQHWGAYLIFDT